MDECFEETDSCDDGDDGDEACVNTEGSFECVERRRDSDGGVVWVRCPRGYEQGRGQDGEPSCFEQLQVQKQPHPRDITTKCIQKQEELLC